VSRTKKGFSNRFQRSDNESIAFVSSFSVDTSMKSRALAGCLFVLGVGFLCGSLTPAANAQRTIQVPGDAPTVQQGINMANSGDTVNIAPGVYYGAISFMGKAITVQGSGPGVILDGLGQKPVVTFNSGETRSSVLQNVTVRDGATQTTSSAGGIVVSGASPTIQNSIIEGNQKCGIGVFNGAPAILNNEISGNSIQIDIEGCYQNPAGEDYGGGIVISGVSRDGLNAQIIGNTIENNQTAEGSAGINIASAGLPVVENNIIRNNMTNEAGGILVIGDTAPSIVQNLIYGNTINPTLLVPAYQDVGAGINAEPTTVQFASIPLVIANNTIVENTLLLVPGANSRGSQVFVSGSMNQVQFFNNLIIGSGTQSAIDCLQNNVLQPVAMPTFDHNDVYNLNNPDGAPVYTTACTNQTGVSGNISADPLFASGVNNPHPFQLQLSSTAVDAGNNQAPGLPPLDILGQPRIQNAKGLSSAIIDMGVYEYAGVPTPPPPPAGFSLAVNPSSATIKQGQNGMFTVTVTPTASSLGSVLLSCGGLPAVASCSFSPTALNFTASGAQSSTLTISVAAASTSASESPASGGTSSMAVFAGLFVVRAFFVRRKGTDKRRGYLPFRLGAICVISCSVGMTGCGGNKYLLIAPPQTYQVLIQASGVNSGVSKQVAVNLQITQ
jgi:hypothetical protein